MQLEEKLTFFAHLNEISIELGLPCLSPVQILMVSNQNCTLLDHECDKNPHLNDRAPSDHLKFHFKFNDSFMGIEEQQSGSLDSSLYEILSPSEFGSYGIDIDHLCSPENTGFNAEMDDNPQIRAHDVETEEVSQSRRNDTDVISRSLKSSDSKSDEMLMD